ncbi:DUF5659 domain-containing protein [Sinanaerobacter chloroacetimidivorans]|uniref:DUF5659 domain-containing protein n=1 Tax=Sinanaerobacter chloroacetimidivorans TaxID=2818044 RepID=UPI001D03FD25|nr:DUF5659 domain-containing protein [Sinanaerobacter chloroacetimidivorans]
MKLKKEWLLILNKPENYCVIHSLSMANHLVRNGFDIKKVDNSEKNNKLKVFLFYDSPELRQAMATFSQEA